MRHPIVGFVAGLAAVTAVHGGVLAQDMGTVVVQGTRVVAKDAGRSNLTFPVHAVQLSYHVKYADLDLATPQGVAALEKRIDDAARAACLDLGRQFPAATPSDVECAAIAARDAKARMRALPPAGGKR